MNERERDGGMQEKNSGVTERAVHWLRKCSQAAGQSAWLVPPVSLTAHWTMKAGLYSLFQSTAHSIKEEPFIFPSHRPHTLLPPLSIPLSDSPSISFPLSTSTICLCVCAEMPPHNERTNKRSRFSKCGDKLNPTALCFLSHRRAAELWDPP